MRSPVRILLADAPRDGSSGANTKAHRQRINQNHHRLGEPDGRYGIGAETRDKEDINHREDAFQYRFEHHRYCEQENRATDWTIGVVQLRAAKRFLDDRPVSVPRSGDW